MSNKKNKIIEFRNYNLPPNFPLLLLTGEDWRISDVPAKCLHFHNCLEIGVCESDSGTLEFLNSSRRFQKDDITVIPGYIAHTTYSDPGMQSKWSYLFIDIEKFVYPIFSLEFFSKNPSIENMFRSQSGIFPREEYPEIYDLVVYFINVLKHKGPNYTYIGKHLLSALLISIMNIYNTASGSDTFKKEETGHTFSIAPALEYIRENYMHDFPINTLADLCQMSYTHFRRNFTAIMGMSTIEYLNRLRIEKASLLLRTTDYPVLRISETVGFSSLSSFNRHFSEIIGDSPRNWRKKMSLSKELSVFQNNGWMTPPKA